MKWEAQEFLKAVQISLNYLDEIDGNTTLQFRTLDECQVDLLMNENSEGIAQILAACDATTGLFAVLSLVCCFFSYFLGWEYN